MEKWSIELDYMYSEEEVAARAGLPASYVIPQASKDGEMSEMLITLVEDCKDMKEAHKFMFDSLLFALQAKEAEDQPQGTKTDTQAEDT